MKSLLVSIPALHITKAIKLHICTHISFYSHLHSPMSRFTLTAHVNHLILGVPVTHLLPSNHQKPKPSGSISICHYLPLQVWNTSQTQPVNRAVRCSSPLLRSNCRCNTQICPTLPDSCEAHPPPQPPPPQSNPHSILKMGIYMPHTAESKQAHLKVHMLMCDI